LALPRHLLSKVSQARPEGLLSKANRLSLLMVLISSIKEALMKLSLLLALHRFTP
jgi:hypothetical protein